MMKCLFSTVQFFLGGLIWEIVSVTWSCASFQLALCVTTNLTLKVITADFLSHPARHRHFFNLTLFLLNWKENWGAGEYFLYCKIFSPYFEIASNLTGSYKNSGPNICMISPRFAPSSSSILLALFYALALCMWHGFPRGHFSKLLMMFQCVCPQHETTRCPCVNQIRATLLSHYTLCHFGQLLYYEDTAFYGKR